MIGNRAADNISDLLGLYDREFITCAYFTLLGRRPDPQGMNTYLRLVRQGESKIAIVGRLANSPEGRAYGADTPGLSKALTSYRQSRWPIAGALLRWALKLDGHGPHERRLRAIENAVHAHAQDLIARLDRLEATISSTAATVRHSRPRVEPQEVVRTISRPAEQIAVEGGFTSH